jgi:HAMP domain-containing protein
MVSSQALEVLSVIMQWIIAPVAAFVWVLYQRQQNHTTDIAVLKTQVEATALAHDREIKEIRETSRAIMAKLDSIEAALRK